jgi:YggT family protein
MINVLIKLVEVLSQALIWIVILSAILSFFMPPYHSVRRTIDQIVEPLLAPIRRVVPLVGMFDLSPLILIILVQILSFALITLLSVLG